MDITVTFDFWGNVWLVKATGDWAGGTIVAAAPDRDDANTYARNLFRVVSAHGVTATLHEG
jgi:hypothetical protein